MRGVLVAFLLFAACGDDAISVPSLSNPTATTENILPFPSSLYEVADGDGVRLDVPVGAFPMNTVTMHAFDPAQPYYLGIFLVGAYQEILGDLHNLFGDTNTVHVQLSPEGDYDVKEVVAGDTVSEVLQFVDYSPSDLLGRMRNNVEQALRKKLMTIEESRTLINRFRQGMIGYTYLDRE